MPRTREPYKKRPPEVSTAAGSRSTSALSAPLHRAAEQGPLVGAVAAGGAEWYRQLFEFADELEGMIQAHRHAARLATRLMPQAPGIVDTFTARAEDYAGTARGVRELLAR